MPEFFNRDMRVTAGTLEISSRDQEGFAQPLLKMKFKAQASTTSPPNKLGLQIWNLSKDSRTKIQNKGTPIILEAGYSGFVRVLFRGDIRFVSTSREGTNWVTTIEAGDGQKAYKSARVNENLGPNTRIGDALELVGKKLGLDLGNLKTKAGLAAARKKITGWINGGVLSGKATKVFGEIATSMGLQWSIQRGAILLLEELETTEDQPILLSPATGLVGSPEVGEKGQLTLRSLLNGDIFPGRRLKVESSEVDGFFKTKKVVYAGDTWGGEWDNTIEAVPLA